MLPDRVSNPGPLTYESDALPIALRGPAVCVSNTYQIYGNFSVGQGVYSTFANHRTKIFVMSI